MALFWKRSAKPMRVRFRLMACGIYFRSVTAFISLLESLMTSTVSSASSRKICSDGPAGAGSRCVAPARAATTKKRPSPEFDWNLDLRNGPGFESPLSERADGGVIQSRVSSTLRH
jgi:hypothetical protein